MKLIEYDGKAILARHGIAVPASTLIEPGAAYAGADKGCILKAQMFSGGRGKAGLILKAGPGAAQATLDTLRERMIGMGLQPLVMAEALSPPEQEFYLSLRVDGARQCVSLLISQHGGMEIESAAPPLDIAIDPSCGLAPHMLVPQLREHGFPAATLGAVARFASRLYEVFIAEDAELIEVNPLGVMADGRLMALDCKMELDDSAAFRHPQNAALISASLPDPSQSELERRASAANLTFVQMDGNVAVLTAGAGLGMAVVDALHDVGLAAANFIDAQAGLSLEQKIDFVFERAKDPQVEAIAIFFLQTANPLKRTMGRLLEMLDAAPAPKPLCIGVLAAAGGETGMTRAEAVHELEKRGYPTAETFEELAQAVKALLADTSYKTA